MAVLIYYPLLLLLLFWGAKLCKRGEWNDEVLSFAHTKAFLGFCAILILFHHASQQTCAPWLAPFRIRHGLDFFVFVGYLCVAAFFFCSGFGLYTASHRSDAFFKHFIVRRLLPILLPAAFMWFVFFFVEKAKGMKADPPVFVNTYHYIWYVPAILYLYVVFYLAFHRIKKEWISFLILLLGTLLYSVFCFLFGPGTWWYNTHHLFLIGALVAKHREGLLRILKKGYFFWLLISFCLTVFFFWVSNYYGMAIALFGMKYDDLTHFLTELSGQVISAVSFVFLMLLIGMKLRIGNRVLAFLGGFTLELYLVHPLFVQLFDHAFMKEGVKPLYYIKDPALYVAAILILSIPLSKLLHSIVFALTKGRVQSAGKQTDKQAYIQTDEQSEKQAAKQPEEQND